MPEGPSLKRSTRLVTAAALAATATFLWFLAVTLGWFPGRAGPPHTLLLIGSSTGLLWSTVGTLRRTPVLAGAGAVVGVVLLVLSLVSFVRASSPPPPITPGGVVTDSGGVRVVELPSSASLPSRTLEADAGWLPEFALELGRLGDVHPLPGGGAVLLDEMAGLIWLLDPDGQTTARVGRLGEGPGEFSPHGGIRDLLLTDSSFVVPDLQLQRMTEFSFAGTLLATRPFPVVDPEFGAVFAVDWQWHPENGIAFRALGPGRDLILRAHAMGVDTLLTLSLPMNEPNALLPPTTIWGFGHRGAVVVGRSDRARIEAWMPGETAPRWIARWPDEAQAVGATDRAHLEALFLREAEAGWVGDLPAEERNRILASLTLPEQAPLLASILVDEEGRTWVRRATAIRYMGREALVIGIGAGFGGREWWVLGNDGLALEVVTMPERFSPRGFRGRYMYGVLEDSLGEQRPARVQTH